MHNSTFAYLTPTKKQIDTMTTLREAATDYAGVIEELVPDGPDKSYLMRKLREVSMWVNVAVTREPDGTPRSDF